MDHFMVDPERPGNALDLFLKAFNLDVGKGQLITAWLLKAPDISTEKIDELLQKYIERQRGVWKKSEK
ncbi:MAG: hypothetical protein NXI24_21295 [bacterium]|nr:hypothetical protein [bacterium]